MFTFAGNFDIRLELEPLGAIFAAIASSLWIINSVFTLGYMRGNKEKNQTRFFALVAIAIFGTMGIAASANLITLFIFYEALTISTFPLVTHKGDAKAKRGGTIYALALIYYLAKSLIQSDYYLWISIETKIKTIINHH